MENLYKILGVPADASQDAIRTAYRTLAKLHHPDLNPGNAKAEERFKSLSAANAILSDPEKRAQFDRGEIDGQGQAQDPRPSYRDYGASETGRRYARSGAASGGSNGPEFADAFESIFADFGRQSSGPARGRDESYSLSIPLLDAINGTISRMTQPDGRTLEVVIPSGTDEGQTLRLRGQGGAGRNAGPPGDAQIEIHVIPHRFFRRDGRDVRFELPVTLSEAVLGGSVEVPTPRGRVQMRIPPNSNSGTELRLRGRGVPARDDVPAGDLFVTLDVVLGPPDEALTAFLKDWKPTTTLDPRQSMRDSQ